MAPLVFAYHEQGPWQWEVGAIIVCLVILAAFIIYGR